MLIGCWFKPHNAENTIIFKPDKTYNAQLWSDKENALLRYSGKYVALPDSVKLFFEDSLLYSFHFFRGNSGDDNYYLMSDNWYFVQSGSSDCK